MKASPGLTLIVAEVKPPAPKDISKNNQLQPNLDFENEKPIDVTPIKKLPDEKQLVTAESSTPIKKTVHTNFGKSHDDILNEV